MQQVVFIKHIEIEGPGTLGHFLKKNNIPTTILNLYEEDLYLLSVNLDELMAVVILGGPMNVYEEEKYPFLRWEDVFLKEVLKRKIPLLGICLGSQLIAKASGARVYKAPHKEIGWYEVDLSPEGRKDKLFKGINDTLPVFQWHEDTFDLPQNATLLSSDNNLNQAFRLSNVYGLQFHLEVTPGMIKDWAESYLGKDRDDFLALLVEYGRLKTDFEYKRDIIFRNFLSLILPKK